MDEIMFRHVRLLQQKHFGKKVDCVTKFDKLLCILKYGHTRFAHTFRTYTAKRVKSNTSQVGERDPGP